MSAEEVHQLGLDRMAALTARADAIFKAQGMTKGSVAERMRALGKDPRFLYPNTDKGKADLIAKLNEQIQEMQRRLRSEEHTSELQSLMRISYAGFCLKKKKHNYDTTTHNN